MGHYMYLLKISQGKKIPEPLLKKRGGSKIKLINNKSTAVANMQSRSQ